ALSLAQERPRRLVIGHVLLRGHARNGAADHVESQVLQRFEADATFTHVELLAALLVFAGEPGGESGMTVEAEEMQTMPDFCDPSATNGNGSQGANFTAGGCELFRESA